MTEKNLARVDGLPKPDQQSELPRLSPALSEQRPNIHGIGPDTDGGPNPDYRGESANDRLTHTLLSTMDGLEWAKGFVVTMHEIGVQMQSEHTFGPMTDAEVESWMLGWFCNAIMAGFDEANRRRDRELQSSNEAYARLGAKRVMENGALAAALEEIAAMKKCRGGGIKGPYHCPHCRAKEALAEGRSQPTAKQSERVRKT